MSRELWDRDEDCFVSVATLDRLEMAGKVRRETMRNPRVWVEVGDYTLTPVPTEARWDGYRCRWVVEGGLVADGAVAPRTSFA